MPPLSARQESAAARRRHAASLLDQSRQVRATAAPTAAVRVAAAQQQADWQVLEAGLKVARLRRELDGVAVQARSQKTHAAMGAQWAAASAKSEDQKQARDVALLQSLLSGRQEANRLRRQDVAEWVQSVEQDAAKQQQRLAEERQAVQTAAADREALTTARVGRAVGRAEAQQKAVEEWAARQDELCAASVATAARHCAADQEEAERKVHLADKAAEAKVRAKGREAETVRKACGEDAEAAAERCRRVQALCELRVEETLQDHELTLRQCEQMDADGALAVQRAEQDLAEVKARADEDVQRARMAVEAAARESLRRVEQVRQECLAQQERVQAQARELQRQAQERVDMNWETVREVLAWVPQQLAECEQLCRERHANLQLSEEEAAAECDAEVAFTREQAAELVTRVQTRCGEQLALLRDRVAKTKAAAARDVEAMRQSVDAEIKWLLQLEKQVQQRTQLEREDAQQHRDLEQARLQEVAQRAEAAMRAEKERSGCVAERAEHATSVQVWRQLDAEAALQRLSARAREAVEELHRHAVRDVAIRLQRAVDACSTAEGKQTLDATGSTRPPTR